MQKMQTWRLYTKNCFLSSPLVVLTADNVLKVCFLFFYSHPNIHNKILVFKLCSKYQFDCPCIMHFVCVRSVILEHQSWFLTQRTCLWWAPSLGWPLKWSRVCPSQKHVTPTHMAWSVLIFVVWMCCDHVFLSLCPCN